MSGISENNNFIDKTFSLTSPLSASKNNPSNHVDASTQTEMIPAKKAPLPFNLKDLITQRILINPYTLKCGHSFGKLSLTGSLRYRTTCPHCRDEITSEDVKPNPTLAKEIKEYVNKNPLNKKYYKKQKAAVLKAYGHLANQSVHPGKTVRGRSDFPENDYPSLRAHSMPLPSSIPSAPSIMLFSRENEQTNTSSTLLLRANEPINTSPTQSNISTLRDMFFLHPIDQMANLFFTTVSELPPGRRETRIAEYNEFVRRGWIHHHYKKGDGIFRFKRYFSSLFNIEAIPRNKRARTLFYLGFSGKLKKLTNSIALLSNKVFNSYYQFGYSPRSIYKNIESQAKRGYLSYAESLVTGRLKEKDVHWRDKGYAIVAKEHIANEISDENLNEVHRLGGKIKDVKMRDNLFAQVAKECARKKEYTKASMTISKISSFFHKTFLFGFIGLLATLNFFHTMIDVMLLPFRYIIKTFIED